MSSVVLGLVAALAWGVHDLLVRVVSRSIAIPVALLAVLATGTLASLAVALTFGDELVFTASTARLGALAGLCYAGACLGLYHAFAAGPVKLVAPIIGAYPVLSVGWAAVKGTPITLLNWLSVLIIVAGVALVAVLSDTGDIPHQRRRAIVFAVLSGVGFAATFALGQSAAGEGGGWAVLLLARLVAMALVGAIIVVQRPSFASAFRSPGVLSGMGVLDASALAFVTLAGTVPNPEFAAVTTSTFGVVTILLARLFLGERVSLPQWGGIAAVFLGVALLGWP